MSINKKITFAIISLICASVILAISYDLLVNGAYVSPIEDSEMKDDYAVFDIDSSLIWDIDEGKVNSSEYREDLMTKKGYLYIPNVNEEKSKITGTKDQFGSSQWAFDYMDIPEAWEYIDKVRPKDERANSDKVRVVSLDTGVSVEHQDLQKNINKELSVDITKKKGEGYAPLTEDKQYHGTSTAGIIAATSNNELGGAGMAAGTYNDLVDFVGVCVFEDGRNKYSQGTASTDAIIKGIEYAESIDADVINMCLGHDENILDSHNKHHDIKRLGKAVRHAEKQGIVIIASAGNSNNAKPWYPSDYTSTISVMSAKHYNDAYGNVKRFNSNYGLQKDVIAPGTRLFSTSSGKTNQYTGFSNSSSATASTTSVVALMKFVNPDLTTEQVRQILRTTATDVYSNGRDKYTGSGLVNAYSAVAAANGENLSVKPKKQKPQNIAIEQIMNGRIQIQWDKQNRTKEYQIFRKNAEDSDSEFKRIGTTKAPHYSDKTARSGRTYIYGIRSVGTTSDGKKVRSDMGRIRITAN